MDGKLTEAIRYIPLLS